MKQVAGYWFPDDDQQYDKLLTRNFNLGNLYASLYYVKNWGVAIDGGAHIGVYARILAAKFKKVYCYEPVPENFECLIRNTQGLKNIVYLQNAIGQRKRKCGIVRHPKSSVGHKVMEGDGVAMIPIGYEADFIKLDIEGWEQEGVKGYQRKFNNHPVWMIEEKRLRKSCRDLLTDYERIELAKPDVLYK